MNENPKNDGPHLIIFLLELFAVLIPPFAVFWCLVSIVNPDVIGGRVTFSLLVFQLGTALSFWILATFLKLLREIRDGLNAKHLRKHDQKLLEAVDVIAEEARERKELKRLEAETRDELARQEHVRLKEMKRIHAIELALKEVAEMKVNYPGEW